MKRNDSLERAFRNQWDMRVRDMYPRPPDPVAQCRFHPDKGWIYDYCWIDKLLALDIQGGGFVMGAHSREGGMTNDYYKHNAAVLMGWRPLLASRTMILNEVNSLIDTILELLKQPVLSPNAERVMWTARICNLTKTGTSVMNNGIRVERKSGAAFVVTFATGEHKVRAKKLADARQQVLELILSAEWNKFDLSGVARITEVPSPILIVSPPRPHVDAVVGITQAVNDAKPTAVPVEVEAPFVRPMVKPSPALRREDDIANYFKSLSSPPPRAPAKQEA